MGSLLLIGSSGNDSLLNVGAITSSITFEAGAGDDLLVNSGQQTGQTRYRGGSGNDRFWLTGAFSNDIQFDAGDDNDTFVITETATDASAVTMIAGRRQQYMECPVSPHDQGNFTGGDGDDQSCCVVPRLQPSL